MMDCRANGWAGRTDCNPDGRTDGLTDRHGLQARRMQKNLKEDNSLINSASGWPLSAWIRPSYLALIDGSVDVEWQRLEPLECGSKTNIVIIRA